jgi:DNA-binding protein WhiA
MAVKADHNSQSFTSIVKEELTTKPFEHNRLLAIFAGFTKSNGRYAITKKKSRMTLTTPYAKIAKFLYQTSATLFHIQPQLEFHQHARFQKQGSYNLVFLEGVDALLKTIHLDVASSSSSYLNQFTTLDAIAGYVTGLFLASGSVNHPESSNYHLEIASDDEDFVKQMYRLFKRVKNFAFDFRLIQRKNKWILYIKKSDQIADFLSFMGATDATLEFENIRVSRDFFNSENRLQICQTANMTKTIQAAKQQIQNIQLIDKVVGLKSLSNPKVIHLCQLRLEHDSSSLEELSQMMSLAYASSVSKSNLNHWFRAIHQLAKKLQGQQ